MSSPTTVVISGTSGIGKEVARHFSARDGEVFVSGRDAEQSK